MKPLAPIRSVIFRSPSPKDVYAYSPGICALEGGRLLATCDMGGPGVKDKVPDVRLTDSGEPWRGRAYLSDDGGDSWRLVTGYPFIHARPFAAGGRVYILGQSRDLCILCSCDNGETWGEPVFLTQGERWHQAPCNVWYANGCVYLVMEQVTPCRERIWPVSVMAPVLMRARLTDDLTRRESWTFASKLVFRDEVRVEAARYFGFPMYSMETPDGATLSGRYCAPFGWLETNVVQIMDENHIWYDPTGHTFHLFTRAHSGHTGYCCVLKVTEQPDGSMTTRLEQSPSGAPWVYLPLPGGQMKFHMLYDQPSRRYWLLSTQSTDSTVRPERMAKERYNLPDNERRRLQLHFSANCVDWCFAGLVDAGQTELESRHYAAMCVRGDDLCIVSRSGDRESVSAHDCNLISFHTVHNFRELVY